LLTQDAGAGQASGADALDGVDEHDGGIPAGPNTQVAADGEDAAQGARRGNETSAGAVK
jgi:hypothetical protein